MPAKASLRQLVRTAKGRWWAEQSYREMKEEQAPDHYEGSSWVGWHHRMVLVMLAYAFVVSYRRQKRGTPPAAYQCARGPLADAAPAAVLGRKKMMISFACAATTRFIRAHVELMNGTTIPFYPVL